MPSQIKRLSLILTCHLILHVLLILRNEQLKISAYNENSDILTKYDKYIVRKLYLNYQIVIWRQIRCLLAITDYSFYKMKMKHRVFDKINMGLSLSF